VRLGAPLTVFCGIGYVRLGAHTYSKSPIAVPVGGRTSSWQPGLGKITQLILSRSKQGMEGGMFGQGNGAASEGGVMR
jgi:hypothetical protein